MLKFILIATILFVLSDHARADVVDNVANQLYPLCLMDYTLSQDWCMLTFNKSATVTIPGGPGFPFPYNGFAPGYNASAIWVFDVHFPCHRTNEQRIGNWLYDSVTGNPVTPAEFAMFDMTVPYLANDTTTHVANCRFPLADFQPGGGNLIHDSADDVEFIALLGQVVLTPRYFATDSFNVNDWPSKAWVRIEAMKVGKAEVLSWNTKTGHILQGKIRTDKYQTGGWSGGGGTANVMQGGVADASGHVIPPDPTVTSLLSKSGAAYFWTEEQLEKGHQGPAMYFATATDLAFMNRVRPQAANHHPDQYTFFPPGSDHIQNAARICKMAALSDYLGQQANDYAYSWSSLPAGVLSYVCPGQTPPAGFVRNGTGPLLPWSTYDSNFRYFYTLFAAYTQFDNATAKAQLRPEVVETHPDNVNNNPLGFHAFFGPQCGDKTYHPNTTPQYLDNKWNPLTPWFNSDVFCLQHPAKCGWHLGGSFNYFETQPNATQRAQYC